jgi:hypothetical protein
LLEKILPGLFSPVDPNENEINEGGTSRMPICGEICALALEGRRAAWHNSARLLEPEPATILDIRY